MAVVTWPLSSGEARGRVGGLVYNTWRGRSYVKAHEHHQTGLSDKQLVIQGYARAATLAWQALTDGDRAPWEHFADLHAASDWTGSPKRITAYNWYIRNAVRAQMVGEPLPDPPPLPLPAYLLTGFFIDVLGEDANLYWTPSDPPPDPPWYIDTWRTAAHSPAAHPSIKMASRYDFFLEQDGGGIVTIPYPGSYTIFARPLAAIGLAMPFTPTIVAPAAP